MENFSTELSKEELTEILNKYYTINSQKLLNKDQVRKIYQKIEKYFFKPSHHELMINGVNPFRAFVNNPEYIDEIQFAFNCGIFIANNDIYYCVITKEFKAIINRTPHNTILKLKGLIVAKDFQITYKGKKYFQGFMFPDSEMSYKFMESSEFDDIMQLEEMISLALQEKRENYLIECEKEQKILELTQEQHLNEFQNNLELSGVESDAFNKLLNKHQKTVIDIDKTYVQKFVKISLYFKSKRNNLRLILNSIRETDNQEELNEVVELLKNQVHTHDLLVLHSLSMLTSLVKQDLITFYQIYETFDELGVFNSNWENEVASNLEDVAYGIKNLLYQTYKMEREIIKSIENLTYTMEDSFTDLSISIQSELTSINSSIKFNNLLSSIQTFKQLKM